MNATPSPPSLKDALALQQTEISSFEDAEEESKEESKDEAYQLPFSE